jgi:hypothetical protein
MKNMKKSLLLIASIGLTAQAFAAETTHNYPKTVNQYSQSKYIFVSSTNGSGFCSLTKGGNSRMVAAEMFCGEDESTYNEFDWYSKTWNAKSTGSKNQCYPIFKQITCN